MTGGVLQNPPTATHKHGNNYIHRMSVFKVVKFPEDTELVNK